MYYTSVPTVPPQMLPQQARSQSQSVSGSSTPVSVASMPNMSQPIPTSLVDPNHIPGMNAAAVAAASAASQWTVSMPGDTKAMQNMSADMSILAPMPVPQTAGRDFPMSAMDSVLNHQQMQYFLQRQQQAQLMHPHHPNHQQQLQPHPDAHFIHHDTTIGSADNSQLNDSFDQSRDDDMDSSTPAPTSLGVHSQATAATTSTTSKSGRTSANNELEMRILFQSNRHRSLQDVAHELHGNERGPNSERNRQVFAMLWLNTVCSRGKGSVPRGRVYANYASRCATERITVLNPASFGKLVRVLFPGLRTRRLGVRGESKYHYVNFCLAEDQVLGLEPAPPTPLPELTGPNASYQSIAPAPTSATTASAPASATTSSTSANQSYSLSVPQHTVDTTASTPSTSCNGTHVSEKQKAVYSPPSYSLYHAPEVTSFDLLPSTASKTMIQMSLTSHKEELFEESMGVVLPSLDTFIPQGTDPDAAKSLAALYRSHCTSLIECIRYCKEKTFFHLYTSFQGTLTMPVQKLFARMSVAGWIEECDFILYQRMMLIVSGLTLQVVPKPVLDTLRNISERLVNHIRRAFHGQPAHVIQAKEIPATIFAALLDRALRVNLTAHAAANMLSNPANRDQMYSDWICTVRVRKVAECVPARGMDDLVKVLLAEIRNLLDPASVPWEVECLTIYGDVTRDESQTRTNTPSTATGQNVLDRWVAFLHSLPDRFPYASAVDIMNGVQSVGTSVMRDLTLSQGKSFGSWWVTKCWIDEMIIFMAENGGFMQQKCSLERTKHNMKQSLSSSTPPASTTAASNVEGRDNTLVNTTTSMASISSTAPLVSQDHDNSLSFSSSSHNSQTLAQTQPTLLATSSVQLAQFHHYQQQQQHLQMQQSYSQPQQQQPGHQSAPHGSNDTPGERTKFPSPPIASNASPEVLDTNSGSNPNDDSGIGIRTPEEDFPSMEKFAFPVTDEAVMMSTSQVGLLP